jgi:protein-disulfide isomerase
MRFLLPFVMAAGFALPVQALDLDAMNDAETQAFGQQVRAYLLANPQVLMEVVAVLEAEQASAATNNDVAMVNANAAYLFEDENSWVGGNPDGDLTIVEFLDYRCGYCRRAHPEVAELVSSDGNIRVIVKELPILGEQSTLASRFAVSTKIVAGDDAYKDVSDALMNLRGDVTETSLSRLAEAFELDGSAIFAKMNSEEVNEVLALNSMLAQRLQISGTPTFVFGDQMLRGYAPLDQMRIMVDDIRETRG